MDDPLQILLRMLPIFVFFVLRSLSEQPATPTPTPTPRDARPFQLPPRRPVPRIGSNFGLRVSSKRHPRPPPRHIRCGTGGSTPDLNFRMEWAFVPKFATTSGKMQDTTHPLSRNKNAADSHQLNLLWLAGHRRVGKDPERRLAPLLRGLGGDGGGCDGAGRAHEGQCRPASELVGCVRHEHSPCGWGFGKVDWNDSSELNRCGGGASVPVCSLRVQP